ncbi:MAG: hypothetical protein HFE51_08695, partial [Clostridia bacterium]|nr:hypothetical protein [Clostridia bacterium]
MKFNKAMTKFLSALIMASMVGTSVQIPTLAEITNAGQAIVDGVKDNNVKDTEGSTESKDTAAAGDEDNKESKDAEAEKEAASNNAANNANAGGSRGEGRTSSSSAYNSSSSSSDTTQVLQPFSTENDSKELWFDNAFSLLSYYGAKQTITATAANGDGNDIIWEVEPKFVSLSEPRVEGDKSTVDITWDGETVESIERTPFYAMLRSNPAEKITGTLYLSNGQAPTETDTTEINPGSKTEFESEEVRKFVEEMYATGLTQDNSVYDLSSFGDSSSSTPDYSTMSDEDILKLFEEKQANEEKENNDKTDEKTEGEDNDKEDESDKVDEDKSEDDEKDALYNKEETQSKTNVSNKVDEDTEETIEDNTEENKEIEETVKKTEKKTEKKTVTEEVTKTQQVEKTGTKTTTTEIVSQEPIVEQVTKTVTEEVTSTKEMRVETVVDAAYDEETGETVYTTEEQTITVPTTELVEKTETVEEVVGTNYKVRETVAINDGENTTTEVNEYETTEEPTVGTVVESFTTYTEQEIKEYIAKTVDMEVEEVVTQTADTEVTTAPIKVPSRVSSNSSSSSNGSSGSASVNKPAATQPTETDTPSVSTPSEDDQSNSNVSTFATGDFENRFQTIAIGGGVNARALLNGLRKPSDSQIVSVEVINPNVATRSGDMVTGAGIGQTQIVGKDASGNVVSIIELSVKQKASDVAVPQVATGTNHMIALKADGTVWTWGNNQYGQLGVGYNGEEPSGNPNGSINTTYQTVAYPIQVLKGGQGGTGRYLENIVQVAAGNNFSAALDKNGDVWTWGLNDNYRLGQVTSGNIINIPTRITDTSEVHDIKYITAGPYNMFAIRRDGSVWGWGHNRNGGLGNGDQADQSTP